MDDKIDKHIQKMDGATQTILRPFFAHPSVDDWVHDVLISYFNYFLSIGEKKEVNQAARNNLHSSLKPLVPVGMRESLDRIEEFLYDEFRRKGYFFLGGMTGPYFGPYVWKRTEKRRFEVELPDRRVDVNVFFMYEFLLRSWMHFQTFGKHGAGGWVKRDDNQWEDGLYCVADAYNIEHLDDDPIFQISLLKHEAQHFADKSDFPSLHSVDLEYRAKLVEMIYFSNMKYRFAAIIREASPIKTDPHRYAAHWILKEISENVLGKSYVKDEDLWHAVPYEKIQAEARHLFEVHTQRLQVNPGNRKGVIKGV
jgi:hypothetical protein